MSDERFDSLVSQFFHELMRRQPVTATYFGIHEYDGQLPEGTRKDVERTIKLARDFKESIMAIDPAGLSKRRRLDRDLGIHLADLELFMMEDLRMWEKSTPVPDTVGTGIFLLLSRDFAPLEQRLESMVSRLEAVPRYESNARELVTSPIRLWNEMGLESTEQLPGLFEVVKMAAKKAVVQAELMRRMEEAAQTAKEVMEKHSSWLKAEIIPAGAAEFALGHENVEKLLKLRGLEMTSEEILELGEGYLSKLKEERAELARQMDPDATPIEVLATVKSKHPESFKGAIEEYNKSMKEGKRFVQEKGIATIPKGEKLLVVETPSFLRHIMPFAAYMPPAKFDRVKTGVYLVTPPRTPEMMVEHSYASIQNVTVHEGYPGHHLQLTWAALNPSLVRALVDGPEFVEGWAFYCEEMMKDAGFHDDREHRLIMVNDLVWRAVRILLDVKLHRGEIGFDEAVDFLVEETGMERPAALAEVKRYTMSPAYPLSYLLGKHLILQLKEKLEEELGDRFDLRKLHDVMLKAGSLPIKFMRRLVKEELTARA